MDKNDPRIIEISSKLNVLLNEHQTSRRIPPKWGVHDDVSPWDYFDWDAFGSGSIRGLGHTPAHFKYDWESGGDKSSAGMTTGRALHACVLEPDTEWPRYVSLPEGRDRRNKEYKELADEHGKDFVLTKREYDSCIGGRDSLFAHSRVSVLMAEGRPELSFAWKDPDTGLPLKGRADWLNERIETVMDLKQTGDAREPQFRKIAKSLGYPVQGVQYINGLRHHEVPVKHYAIVVVEADPPYGVMFYRVSTKDLIIAEGLWQAYTELLAWCIENARWPSYPEHTRVLHMGQYWEAEAQEEIALIQELMAS